MFGFGRLLLVVWAYLEQSERQLSVDAGIQIRILQIRQMKGRFTPVAPVADQSIREAFCSYLV